MMSITALRADLLSSERNFLHEFRKISLCNYPPCLSKFYVFMPWDLIETEFPTRQVLLSEMCERCWKGFGDLRIGGNSDSCGCLGWDARREQTGCWMLESTWLWNQESHSTKEIAANAQEHICLSSRLCVAAPGWGGCCSELASCYFGLPVRPASLLGVCWKKTSLKGCSRHTQLLPYQASLMQSPLLKHRAWFSFGFSNMLQKGSANRPLSKVIYTLEEACHWSKMGSFLGPLGVGISSFFQVYLLPYELEICRHLSHNQNHRQNI